MALSTIKSSSQLVYDDTVTDLELWQKQQVLRIESIEAHQVLSELRDIMEGHNYSWYSIKDLLQARFDNGDLAHTLIDGDVLFEWNNLCNEKRVWEKRGHLSVDRIEFNKDCLINLKLLPIQAGLGTEGKLTRRFYLQRANIIGPRLVTQNLDNPYVFAMDLWVGPKNPDSKEFKNHIMFGFPASDTSTSESEDSEYEESDEEKDEEIEGSLEHDDEYVDNDDNISDLEL
jgi:hypothetical protein